MEKRGRIQMTGGFILRHVITELGHKPTAEELSAFTKAKPKMFPAPGWTVKQAQQVLDHPDELLTPV